MEFQRNIEKTQTKVKLNHRVGTEIIMSVQLSQKNECLKNEVRNSKDVIQTLLNGEKKEQWIAENKRNSEAENKFYEHLTPVPLNLTNCLENLEEPNIAEKHNDVTPRNSHTDRKY